MMIKWMLSKQNVEDETISMAESFERGNQLLGSIKTERRIPCPAEQLFTSQKLFRMKAGI
jgi:hypothetical protein